MTTPADSDTTMIADDEFCMQLQQLRRLRQFLVREGLSRTKDGREPLSLDRLNLIKSDPKGKMATFADWKLLEKKQDDLQRLFSPELQHRFRLEDTQSVIIYLSLGLFVGAFLPLIYAFAQPGSRLEFPCYLVWTFCLGGLGSLGFLLVNSLAVQRDATFDISNRLLIYMRTMLGALLGCVLSLPFLLSFKNFIALFHGPQARLEDAVALAPYLLSPFVLGFFSTSLVLTVLNRLASGIQTVFGMEQGRVSRR